MESDNSPKYTPKGAIFTIISWLGMFVAISGVLIFINQCYKWLQQGYWTPHPIKFLFQEYDISTSWVSQIEWKGISKILFWFLNQSSVLLLIVLGVIIFAYAAMNLDDT